MMYSKIAFAALFSAFIFSSASSAEPVDDLVAAMRSRDEDLAKQVFAANDIDPNLEVPTNEFGEARPGQSILFLATYYGLWELVEEMLDRCPHPNVNAGPTMGSHRGTTVLWQTVRAAVDMDLDRFYWQNEGTAEGLPNVLKLRRWELVPRMLLADPSYDLNASEADGDQYSAYRLIRACPVLWIQKLMIILEMNRDFDGIDLTARLKMPFWGVEKTINHFRREVCRVFKLVAIALPELNNPITITESSNLDVLPVELIPQIALNALRAADKDLTRIPDQILLKLLGRFQRVYKARALAEDASEIIAAGVLNVLDPIDRRRPATDARAKRFDLIKSWIRKELLAATKNGILPYSLTVEVRPLLVRLFSTKSPSAISRAWIRDTIRSFAAGQRAEVAVADADARVPAIKREREADIVEEARVVRYRPDNDFEEANRAEITQAIIDAQPVLGWREIEAEVENIMSGTTPMQIDPLPFGDHNNNEEPDVEALLRMPALRDWSYRFAGDGSGQM